MLVALDTSRQQQQRLIMDASHELRTPLTAVRTNIDFLAHATTLGAEERAQLIEETRLELDELTNLVSEMVELATDVRNEEPVDAVDLGEVAGDVAQRFRRRTGREIDVDTETAGTVEGRRSMLDRAVSNLVDNALKFSPADEPVAVTVRGAAHRGRRPRPRRAPTTTAPGCSTASTGPPAPARCPGRGSDCRSWRRSPSCTAAGLPWSPVTAAARWRHRPHAGGRPARSRRAPELTPRIRGFGNPVGS